MPVVNTFLPAAAGAAAHRYGISLDRRSVSYVLEALHCRKKRESFDRSSCMGALNALLGRPVFARGQAPRTNMSVRAHVDLLRRVLDIDTSSLKVVQVAGSKGKGSTCAFVEHILHKGFGVKTGLFTSPHLVSATERFRINTEPVSEELFVEHFWWIWDKLYEAGIAFDHDHFPSFFTFFTLMAVRIFMQQGVEIAILEVGIGGRLDSTTAVIDNLAACAISVLDYDHTSMLGNTLTQIAGEKAAVMRDGLPACIIEQREEGLQELQRIGAVVGARVRVVKSLKKEPARYSTVRLGIPGDYQYDNAALARAVVLELLAAGQISGYAPTGESPASLTSDSKWEDNIQGGLQQTRWLGRCTIMETNDDASDEELTRRGELVLAIDGAHTALSLKCCGEWFRGDVLATRPRHQTALMFNCGLDRSPVELLRSLVSGCGVSTFDHAVFAPSDSAKFVSPQRASRLLANNLTKIRAYFQDDFNYTIPAEDLGVRLCIDGAQELSSALQWSLLIANVWARLAAAEGIASPKVWVCQSLAHASKHLMEQSASAAAQDQSSPATAVLVTGSLYLVGSAVAFAHKNNMVDKTR